MACRQHLLKNSLAVLVALVVFPVNTRPPAFADISSRTVQRDYRVRGRDAPALVNYMHRRPFAGDNGPAMANIRPRYDLRILTKPGTRRRGDAAACHIHRLTLSIRFTMTLPHAVHERQFDNHTRRAWQGFKRFARRHEEVHRRIYLSCAQRFLHEAGRMSSPHRCSRLRRDVQRLLRESDRACNRQHDAFDRRDFPRVKHMSLFRLARQGAPARSGRRSTVTRAAARVPVTSATGRTWFGNTLIRRGRDR
ncbi:DUF922 domain-containing protein [Breoghania sp. L-A4]|uniref:DUF922 domain-containing protein n=1 Tax=Breoghania sp. L-A4 TaxID=2304600 RepID=UPI000E35C391|nr:DUF922 domain-containing protein [Breoghania sp. L-A4]AXS40961.1 DUF922 domain-containing protein [Breoghania sp. L-A4]